MRNKLRTVQSLASRTLKDSQQAYNEALSLYQQAVSLDVPSADHARIEDQSDKIRREAERIQAEATRLVQERQELLREAQEKRVALEDLLARARQQQEEVERQHADAKSFREMAEAAVEGGDNVLNDARNTLNTLQGGVGYLI